MRVTSHVLLWRLGFAPPETQTSATERHAVAAHAAGRRRLVEIGVWHGVTTALLRSVMAPDGTIWAIDPFPRGRLGFSAQRYIAQRVVAGVPRGRVRWVRATAVAAASTYAATEDPAEFVFIDGDHSYAGLLDDWRAWSPLVAPGGIVCLHDSRSSATRDIDSAGSVIVTQEVILRDPRFEALGGVETLTVLRRRC